MTFIFGYAGGLVVVFVVSVAALLLYLHVLVKFARRDLRLLKSISFLLVAAVPCIAPAIWLFAYLAGGGVAVNGVFFCGVGFIVLMIGLAVCVSRLGSSV